MTTEPTCSVAATVLGEMAREALLGNRRGTLAALFQHSLYARLGDDWVCVGEAAIGRGPLNLLLDTRLPSERLQLHMPVTSTEHGLLLGDRLLVEWHAAQRWHSSAAPQWSPASLRVGLATLDSTLCNHPADSGGLGGFSVPAYSPVTLLARRAAPAVNTLGTWIERAESGVSSVPLVAAVSALLGLGPGLTPSGDDFLAGMLVALQRCGRPAAANSLWQVIETQVATATHDISAAHLRAASRGQCCELLDTLLGALLRGDAEQVFHGVDRLAACEHLSASDGLAGMVITLRAALAVRSPVIQPGHSTASGG